MCKICCMSKLDKRNPMMHQKRHMSLFALTLLVILTILLINPVFSGGGDEEKARQAWPLIHNGALLIDVRTKEEFDAGHLDGAVNIPWEDTGALKQAIGNDKQRPVVLYCRSGNRSGKSIVMLEKQGYTNLHNGTGLEALNATKP